MNSKNMTLLVLSQILGFSVAPISVFLSGIIGSTLSPLASLATIPLALMILGQAIFTLMASYLMSKIGRKKAFITAACSSSCASLLAAHSLNIQNFYLYCCANFALGIGLAFVQQYRFAASENMPQEDSSKAVSIIILSGIISAFLGPNVASLSKHLIPQAVYSGSYLCLAVLTLIPSFLFIFYQDQDIKKKVIQSKVNTKLKLLSNPKFLQAVCASAGGYAIMTMIMTAAPISMHIINKISLNLTSLVIQIHMLSMFLPSLITGFLIKRFNHHRIIYCGLVSYLICISLSIMPLHFFNYLCSLVFLGLGWNFLFISGTSLLIKAFNETYKFKAQGLNEFIVFSFQALASLSAGFIIMQLNWTFLNLLCLPIVALIAITNFYAEKNSSPNSKSNLSKAKKRFPAFFQKVLKEKLNQKNKYKNTFHS